MKFIQYQVPELKSKYVFQEAPDGRLESIAGTLRAREETQPLDDERIQELARQFAEIIPPDMDFGVLLTQFEADLDDADINSWVDLIEARLESDDPSHRRAIERALAAPNDEREPSGVAIPLTPAEFNTLYDALDVNMHIPESMRGQIQAYVLHNFETSADPNDDDNQDRIDLEDPEVQADLEAMILNQAVHLRVLEMAETQLNGEPLPEGNDDVESTADVVHRIAGEFEHVSPNMLMQAVASNHGGIGLDENGQPTALTEEAIEELAERLNQTGERVAEELEEQGYTPGTPAYQQAYNERMAAAANEITDLSQVRTLGDLIRLFLHYMDRQNNPNSTAGGPVDRNGRPLDTTVPRGSTRGAEVATDHRENISLNSEYYGEALVNEFRELPEASIQAAQQITDHAMWGDGDLIESDPSEISGWKLAVMRNAVNSNRYGQTFSADRPFFANDLAARRALIYLPGQGQPLATVCHAGSGGVSNVSESHGSPVGSFYFQPSDVVHHGNSHRYRSQATVHGMEPMRSNYRTDYEQGSNIDPSAGNTNTAGRAILMHGSNGTTWGCWGIPPANAEIFARAIQAGGGANGEAFLSTR